MSTNLKPLQVREEFLNKKLRIFTPLDFKRIFNLSDSKTKYFLEEETKRGLFIRLKKGLYALKTDLPDEKFIANMLYKPSYISFEYALAFYNILPEMPYAVTSAITKPTRTFTVSGKPFTYLKIKRNAYTGYILMGEGENRFYMAEPEKALVDYFYFLVLGKKSHNERLDFSSLNKEKLLAYASLYERDKLIKLFKKST